MSDETPKRRGLISIIRESLTKTGGCCCGPGETCGGPVKPEEKPPEEEAKDTDKPVEKK